jgi:predicted transport protein
MYNYKIKILCKTEDILCYNNEDSSNKHLFCNNEDIYINYLLFYNNKEISKKNPNKQNLKKLIDNTIIEKALILHKKIINTTTIKKELLQKQLPNFTTKPLKFMCNCGNEIYEFEFDSFRTESSLEFMCKHDSEISEDDFQIFIKRMKYNGFSSIESNTINLIKINNNKSEELICKYNFQAETKINIKENNYKINYKIKIGCTSEDELCYNNKKISNKNYNKPNFEELMNNTDYIETALILYKKILYKKFTTKSLEFMCKREISEDEFKTFIESMKKIGFKSNNDNTIHLIKINDNKPSKQIFIYNFQSEEKINIIPKNNNYNYKIKIEWTSKDELCYNNEEISININDNLNLKELKNTTNYINDFKYIDLKTKSLEFNCNSKISDIDFNTFIKDMQNIGFFSNKDILIHLISNKEINKISSKKTISIYKFQSIIKIHNYSTQFLYKKI